MYNKPHLDINSHVFAATRAMTTMSEVAADLNLTDLQRQLAGRSERQHLREAVFHIGAWIEHRLNERNAKRSGLSRPGLGAPDHISSRQCRRDGLLLDGSR
mgnify:CR=1 FL=1